MILKASIWLESNNFSKPEVEKAVMEDLFRVATTDLIKLDRNQLDEIEVNYSPKIANLARHLKELESVAISQKRVLEKMRTGLGKDS